MLLFSVLFLTLFLIAHFIFWVPHWLIFFYLWVIFIIYFMCCAHACSSIAGWDFLLFLWCVWLHLWCHSQCIVYGNVCYCVSVSHLLSVFHCKHSSDFFFWLSYAWFAYCLNYYIYFYHSSMSIFFLFSAAIYLNFSVQNPQVLLCCCVRLYFLHIFLVSSIYLNFCIHWTYAYFNFV